MFTLTEIRPSFTHFFLIGINFNASKLHNNRACLKKLFSNLQNIIRQH